MNILLFDTETTGLTLHPDVDVSKQPRMIEFGAVVLNSRTNQIEEEDVILVNPGQPISAEITKITGLSDADVADAPLFPDVLPTLRRLFGAAGCVVAHNLPFDKTIIKGELKRAGTLDFPWPQIEICTVALYAEEWGRNPRMLELYERVMGKPLDQTHRALDDVKALAEIFIKENLAELLK